MLSRNVMTQCVLFVLGFTAFDSGAVSGQETEERQYAPQLNVWEYDQLQQSQAAVKMLRVDACRNDPLAPNARAAGDVELKSETRPQIPDPALSAKGKVPPLVWPFTAGQAKAAQESLAKSLGKNVIEKNSLGMELVIIPPGKFMMGSPANEEDRHQGEDEDEGQVQVTLTAPFWLGKTEVTKSQWEKIMGTTPWKGQVFVEEGPDYAATDVSWDDVQKFLKKLSQRDGVTYRLPTEAEWEWSCRAGTSSRFSFGDNDSELDRYGWYGGIADEDNADAEEYAQQVGKKLANPFGLYDMHGNVWEWCEDVKIDQLPGGNNPKVLIGGNYRV